MAAKDDMYQALRENNVEKALSIMEEKKLSPNTRFTARDGEPLLQSAIKGELPTGEKFNGDKLASALIERQANVNLRLPSGRTLLHEPTLSADTAKKMIEAGADIHAKVSKTDTQDRGGQVKGESPLHSAVKSGNTELVKVLIEAGADVNARDQNKSTPLLEAAAKKNARAANMLIEAGADLNARSEVAKGEKGVTAAEALSRNGIPLVAKEPPAARSKENTVEQGVARNAELDPEVSALVARQRESLRRAAGRSEPETTQNLDGQAREFAQKQRDRISLERQALDAAASSAAPSADAEARAFAARQRERVEMERRQLNLEARNAPGVASNGPARGERGEGEGLRVGGDKTAQDRSQAVPEHVKQRFVQVDNKYYFPDKTPAFDDKGQKLVTKSENQQVVASLVDIAKERGWEKITVKGTEEFRRAAWLEASMNGLEVSGYKPTAIEKAHLANLVKERGGLENSIEEGRDRARGAAQSQGQSQVRPEQRERETPTMGQAAAEARPGVALRDGVVAGKLLEHGAARYQHDEKKDMSYFVRVQTDNGERTVWGKDLNRAVAESGVKVGSNVALERVETKDVIAKEKVFDRDGKFTGETRDVDAKRNTWKVGSLDKAQAFAFGDREEVVKQHPELAPAYGTVAAAHKFAEKHWPNSKDAQERFVAVAQQTMTERIAHGDPVPAPKIREAQLAKQQGKDQERAEPPSNPKVKSLEPQREQAR